MKSVSAAMVVLLAIFPAVAQDGGAQPRARPAKPKAAAQVRPPAVPKPSPAAVAAYAAMPDSERMAIQAALAWTGDYNGIANGEFGDNSIAAVKAYQKRIGNKDTGILTADERARLDRFAKARRNELGWRLIEDPASGVWVGIPSKLTGQSNSGKAGTRWQSAHGEIQIETFRIDSPGATLAAIFEQQKKEPAQRRPEYSVLRAEFFVISGLQGLKKFYVRAHGAGNEVRGVTILYDQATEGIMDPVVIAMSSALVPFPGPQLAAAGVWRKVEYGTGIVVTAEGHVITDRQITDGCRVVEIAGHGNAEKLAEDEGAGLALLKLFGAHALAPAAFTTVPGAGEAKLVGIADPRLQDGGGAASIAPARLASSGSTMTVAPPPPSGFSGGAVATNAGILGALITQPAVAGITLAGVQATIATGETIARFLSAQGVSAHTGRSDAEAAKASVVRVICVRN